MAYVKQGFTEGMTLTHQHLINMEDGILAASQGGVEDLYASSYGIIPGEVDATKMTALLKEASTKNKTIRFNDGVYIFSQTIAVPSNVSIVGNTKTVFKPKNATTPETLMTINSADNVFISHLILDGGLTAMPKTEGTQIGMSVVSSRSINIENTEFIGWSKQGLYSKTMSSYGTAAEGKFFKQFQITNCRWYFNYCGNYFDYRCEYNQLCNCVWGENYIGTVNCGGNNAYVACQWNANTTGFKMENAGSNPAHGGCNGCTFNHNYTNAIQIDDCVNGWTFEGCQVFYGSIVVNNSQGVVFNGNIWGSCKYKSTGTLNKNMIVNSFFLTSSATILAGNDGSTVVYCCLPDHVPEVAKQELPIIEDESWTQVMYTAPGTSGGASNCYFGNCATPIAANTKLSNLYIAINEAGVGTTVQNVNVWVVNADTNTVLEKIVDAQPMVVDYSNALAKYVLNVELNKTYTHGVYFIVQADRVNKTGIAYSTGKSGNIESLVTEAPAIGSAVTPNSSIVAEIAVYSH